MITSTTSSSTIDTTTNTTTATTATAQCCKKWNKKQSNNPWKRGLFHQLFKAIKLTRFASVAVATTITATDTTVVANPTSNTSQIRKEVEQKNNQTTMKRRFFLLDPYEAISLPNLLMWPIFAYQMMRSKKLYCF